MRPRAPIRETSVIQRYTWRRFLTWAPRSRGRKPAFCAEAGFPHLAAVGPTRRRGHVRPYRSHDGTEAAVGATRPEMDEGLSTTSGAGAATWSATSFCRGIPAWTSSRRSGRRRAHRELSRADLHRAARRRRRHLLLHRPGAARPRARSSWPPSAQTPSSAWGPPGRSGRDRVRRLIISTAAMRQDGTLSSTSTRRIRQGRTTA
jgi:hypothetical protein